MGCGMSSSTTRDSTRHYDKLPNPASHRWVAIRAEAEPTCAVVARGKQVVRQELASAFHAVELGCASPHAFALT